mgnify:FL=1
MHAAIKNSRGKSIDLEGIGANYEVAEVKGFLKEDFISFSKQYPHYYEIDEWGNTLTDKNSPHPQIHYEGYYDAHSKKITGSWEMTFDMEQVGED